MRMKTIGHAEVRRLLAEGAQLVEVLPPAEYERLHLPAALNIPLRDLERGAPIMLDLGRPVVLYCNSFE